MSSLFSQSSFKRVEGSGSVRAKKLADIYIKQHTTGTKVDSPDVYQYAIDNYLSPYADDLAVSSTIEGYKNKAEALAASKQQVSGSLAALKLKEQAAWYVNDDEAGGSTFRDPMNVARITSESLDRLVAETIMASQDQKKNGKDASEIDNYLYDINKKADRMRSIVTQIESGDTPSMEGYGYYVDTDPNTGSVRGASFAPTDIKIDEVSSGKTRTDSTVKLGNSNVAVYIPAIKDASGQLVSKFGNSQYTGNSDLLSGGEKDILLNDSTKYKYDGLELGRGKVYSAYTGETYQDGAPKKKFYYRGYDDKVYSFNEDDTKGQDLIKSLQQVGAVDKNIENIPRINSYSAMNIVTNPLTDTPGKRSLADTAKVMIPALKAGADAQAESDRINSLGFFGKIREGLKSNPNKPDEAPTPDAPSFIDKAKSFFRKSPAVDTTPTKNWNKETTNNFQ